MGTNYISNLQGRKARKYWSKLYAICLVSTQGNDNNISHATGVSIIQDYESKISNLFDLHLYDLGLNTFHAETNLSEVRFIKFYKRQQNFTIKLHTFQTA